MAHPGGRPSKYTRALGAAIYEHMVDGLSVREIARLDGMPHENTIWRWAVNNDEFRKRYAEAMQVRTDRMAEEILTIADDGTNDWVARQGEDGQAAYAFNGEHYQRSRLRVDTRKWIMAKMQPKKYGDRVSAEVSGPDGGPIQIAVEARRREAQELLDGVFGGDDGA